jgi:hypothetical protein
VNEPRPLLDDDAAAPELRRLLAYGTAPRPLDARARERSRRRLAALASVPAAAGVVLWVQNLALGAALGTAASVAVVVGGVVFKKPVAAPPVSNSARPVASARESAAPERAAPRAEVAPSAEVVAEPAPRNSAWPASRPSASAAHEEDDGVAREAALLESARRALGDPGRALSLLARHQHEFPRGVLATERELLMIDALVRAGRRSEAEERGARFRARAPGNFYEERLDRLLGNQGESK